MDSFSFKAFNKRLTDEHIDINKIKKYIVCKDFNKQIMAAECLCTALTAKSNKNNNELYNYLINGDMVEILCEAMSTLNHYLIKLIFKCLESLMTFDKFYKQYHVAYAIDSVLRTLQVFLSSREENEIIISGLELIYHMLHSMSSNGVSLMAVCDVQNVTNFMKTIFKSKIEISAIYTATKIIRNLILNEEIRQCTNNLQENVSESLKALLMNLKSDDIQNCLAITAELINVSLRFLLTSENGRLCSLEKNGKFFNQLIFVLEKVHTPFLYTLINEEDQSINSDDNLLEIILRSILSIYNFPNESKVVSLSHYLVATGFLEMLPQIESRMKGTRGVITVRSVLLELLACLSNVVLGPEDWKNYLCFGLEALPIGASYNAIVCNGSDQKLSLVSIIFNYFLLLSSESGRVETDSLKQISYYISLVEELSAPVTKAVWFVFAVAYLCSSENCQYSKMALKYIVELIRHFDLNAVYTHHPALLYWTFADDAVPDELKIKIVNFWLRDDDEESLCELKSLMKLNIKPCLILIVIMSEVGKEEGEVIMKILRSTLTECSKHFVEQIYEHAWAILPEAIAKYSSFESILNMITFCSDYIPEYLEVTLIFRISSLLCGTFAKHFPLIYDPKGKSLKNDGVHLCNEVFKYICILLQLAQQKDVRVLATITSQKSFLECLNLLVAIEDDVTLCTSLVKLITHLVLVDQKGGPKIQLEVSKLLYFLSSAYPLSAAALRLLATYLELVLSDGKPSIINITFPTISQLRVLYLQIHMLCSKMDDSMAACCWYCLRRLLQLSSQLGLLSHLATLPYTAPLLARCPGPIARAESLLFLRVWAPLLPTRHPRSLRTPSFLRAIALLAASASPNTRAGIAKALEN